MTKGATYQRFIGRIDSWTPSATGADDAVVAVSASDLWGLLGRVKLMSSLSELFRTNMTALGRAWDVWPCDEPGVPTTLRNTNPLGASATVSLPPSSAGTVSFTGAPNDLYVDGVLGFKPDTTGTLSGATVTLRPQAGFTFVQLAIKSTNVAATMILATFSTATGADLYSLRVASGSLGLYDSAGSIVSSIGSAGFADGGWTVIQVAGAAGATGVSLYQSGGGTTTVNFPGRDITTAVTVTIGAGHDSFQSNGFDGSVAGIIAGYAGGTAVALSAYFPSRVDGLLQVSNELNSLVDVISPTATVDTSLLTTASLATYVAPPSMLGKSATDLITALADGLGGCVWATPTPAIVIRDASTTRPTAALATVTIEADDDITAGQVWTRSADTRVTRAGATSPTGSAYAIDTAGEAAGVPPQAANVDTLALTAPELLSVAQLRLAHSSSGAKMRLRKFAVSLATAQNNLYASFLGTSMFPGVRLHLLGLSTAIFGQSYVDVYAMGWTELYSATDALWTFDCAPTDDPAEGKWEDATYGRFGSDGDMTGGTVTAVATTIVVTTAGAHTFTTAAGSYPLDIDFNGERITLNSAPGGAASPQTFTGVTRGVAPSVARAHTAGEPVDVYLAARLAL